MKIRVRLLSLCFLAATTVFCGAAFPEIPDDIARYYDDFNRLTILELAPPKQEGSSRKFTIELPSPEVSLAARLRERLNERRLSVDSRFAPQRAAALHELIFLRIIGTRSAHGQIAVECESYEPAVSQADFVSDISPIDFTRLKLLRRETHLWRASADQWILQGSIQQIAHD